MMGTLGKIIGANVKRLRRAQGWTQADLAERLDVSQPMVAHIEKGGASLEAVEKLTAIFGVSEEELATNPERGVDIPIAWRTITAALSKDLGSAYTSVTPLTIGLDLSHIPREIWELLSQTDKTRMPQLKGFLEAVNSARASRTDDQS